MEEIKICPKCGSTEIISDGGYAGVFHDYCKNCEFGKFPDIKKLHTQTFPTVKIEDLKKIRGG